jgi:hypothetical protein
VWVAKDIWISYRFSRTFADAKKPISKPQIQKIKMRRAAAPRRKRRDGICGDALLSGQQAQAGIRSGVQIVGH